MNNKITAIVIAKNEELMIENCLNTLKWCDEILVVDNDSTDSTVQKAEGFGVRIVSFTGNSFAKLREEALKRVATPWLIYVDADERITPELAIEIKNQIDNSSCEAMTIKRTNFYYGKIFKHGGWQNDLLTRVFKKIAIKGWQGKIHESPVYQGETVLLNTPMIHLSHRNVVDGLKKSVDWTRMEAELLHQAGVPKVKFETIARKGLAEFLRRAWFKKGYQDGQEGLIEAVVQGINKILIYIQVWQLQQKPSLADKYKKQEDVVADLWSKTRL